MEHVTAFAAQPSFQHDIWPRMRPSLSSFSKIKDGLFPVKVRVARLAVGYGFDIFDDSVLDLHVALIALNLVLSDVLKMHQVGVLVFSKTLLLPVAFIAVFPGDIAVPHDHMAVAFVTAVAFLENYGVIVAGGIVPDQLVLGMAVGALRNLGIVLTLLKMADKAGAGCHGYVLPLYDLGVAAGTLQLFPPPQVFEMNLMVKNDIFEIHLAFK